MERFRPVGVKEFYDRIHPQYYDAEAHRVSCRVREIHEEILRSLRAEVNGCLLDVGCASQAPVTDSVGCDISIEGLRIRKASFPGNRSVCADITCLPFNVGSFSAMLAGLLFDHVEEPRLAFEALRSVSGPGARLIVTVFEDESRPGEKYRGDRLHYKSTDGTAYSVPSYGWRRDKLESEAKNSGWLLSSGRTYETCEEGFQLLRLDFRRAG